MTEQDTNSQIARRQTSLQVFNTALSAVSDLLGTSSPLTPELFSARTRLASLKPKEKRTKEEMILARAGSVVRSINSAMRRGLISRSNDAVLLTDALMYSDYEPSRALVYLKEDGNGTKLRRALLPKEIAVILPLYQEIKDSAYDNEHPTKPQFPIPSIATIARIADYIRINLKEELDNLDRERLLANIQEYTFKDRVLRFDPHDQPYYDHPHVAASTPSRQTSSRVDPSYRGEFDEDPSEL